MQEGNGRTRDEESYFYYLIYLLNGIKLEPTYFHISSSFIQLVLAFFARKAILKDEDLIRSVDRIR